jgi:prevent-host-death family protein
MVMKQVMIADLKAKLSEYLRYVRQGHTVTVLDRHTPVAQIVPYEPKTVLRVREPTGPYGGRIGKVPLPDPVNLDVDVVEVLLELRQNER